MLRHEAFHNVYFLIRYSLSAYVNNDACLIGSSVALAYDNVGQLDVRPGLITNNTPPYIRNKIVIWLVHTGTRTYLER